MNEATPFACPTCRTEYKVVRVEAPPPRNRHINYSINEGESMPAGKSAGKNMSARFDRLALPGRWRS